MEDGEGCFSWGSECPFKYIELFSGGIGGLWEDLS